MDKENVTLSTLITIGVTLLSLGINLIQQAQYAVGALCIIVGFGVTVVGLTLYEKGVISKVMKHVGGEKG